MHVVPRHPTCLKNRNLVGDEVINLLEVHDATVVVVLSWEERASEIGGVTVCERAFMRDHDEHLWRLQHMRALENVLIMGVPSTEAHVQTTYTRSVIIYY